MVQIGQTRETLENESKSWRVQTDRPATTHPALPPPQTMISNSSGRAEPLIVIDFRFILIIYYGISGFVIWECPDVD